MNLIHFFIYIDKNIEDDILQNDCGNMNWENSNKYYHINNSLFCPPILQNEQYINKIKDYPLYHEIRIIDYFLNNLVNIYLLN